MLESAAAALEGIESGLYELRSHLHYEVAMCELVQDSLVRVRTYVIIRWHVCVVCYVLITRLVNFYYFFVIIYFMYFLHEIFYFRKYCGLIKFCLKNFLLWPLGQRWPKCSVGLNVKKQLLSFDKT